MKPKAKKVKQSRKTGARGRQVQTEVDQAETCDRRKHAKGGSKKYGNAVGYGHREEVGRARERNQRRKDDKQSCLDHDRFPPPNPETKEKRAAEAARLPGWSASLRTAVRPTNRCASGYYLTLP